MCQDTRDPGRPFINLKYSRYSDLIVYITLSPFLLFNLGNAHKSYSINKQVFADDLLNLVYRHTPLANPGLDM